MLRLFRISLSFPFQAFVVDPTNSSVIRSSIAVAVVVVTVTDRNDNGPVFLSSEYTASVSEAAQTGHIVLTSVEATDVDLVRSRAFQTIIAFLLLCQLEKKEWFYMDCVARKLAIWWIVQKDKNVFSRTLMSQNK